MHVGESSESKPIGQLNSASDEGRTEVRHPFRCGPGPDGELLTLIQLVESLRDGKSIPELAAFRALAEHRWLEWFRGNDDCSYQHFEVLDPVEIDGLLLQQYGERLCAWQPRAAVLEIASMWRRHQRVHPEDCATSGHEDDTWASLAIKFGNLIAFRKSEAIRAGFWPGKETAVTDAFYVEGERNNAVARAARAAGVSESTLRRWIKSELSG